ncbi:hypothetical protein EVAR_58029_1 [Eumeta japonica]|uniref:Uncharacterized protein n=1 Tax=Eumeta variegata TaxID=151549 RepID=A0A4C1ZKQ1_EUMVA|nr:hypothetical protein EVAR_58029_1 [Eumeta japonica]
MPKKLDEGLAYWTFILHRVAGYLSFVKISTSCASNQKNKCIRRSYTPASTFKARAVIKKSEHLKRYPRHRQNPYTEATVKEIRGKVANSRGALSRRADDLRNVDSDKFDSRIHARAS